MVKCECNEQHARLECEPLPNGLTLVRVYEDEQEVTREAVSNVDTPWRGYSYTTYETVTQVPDGRVDVDAWAALVKQADYDTAAAAVCWATQRRSRRTGKPTARRCAMCPSRRASPARCSGPRRRWKDE